MDDVTTIASPTQIQLSGQSLVELCNTLYPAWFGKSFDSYLDKHFARVHGEFGTHHALVSVPPPDTNHGWRIATAGETAWFYCLEREYNLSEPEHTILRTNSYHHSLINHLNTGSPVVILEQRSGKIEITLQYEGALTKDVPALWIKKA